MSGSRPRILLCVPTAYAGGGVEEWIPSLVRALDARGWEPVVGLAVGKTYHRPERFLARYPLGRTLRLEAPSGLREERHFAVLRALRRRRPDVVVPVHLADALFAVAHAKRAGFAGRLVTCLHSQSPGSLADFRLCAGDVDLAVSVSRRGRALLAESAGMPAAAIRHIPTGVPPPATKSCRREAPLELAYVGRLDRREKRVTDLIDLMPRLAGLAVRVHVAGDGPESETLRTALADDVRRDRVVFHGALSRTELYETIYPRVHGVLIFSGAEGGPLVAWEALVHGVVPVSSRFEGMEEEGVLRDGVNSITFPVGDMAAAADAVRRLSDVRLREGLSEAAACLPAAYTEAGFGDAWDRALREALLAPIRLGRQPLPPPFSPGRLSRVISSARLLLWMRRWRGGLRKDHQPGDEWPHTYGVLREGTAWR